MVQLHFIPLGHLFCASCEPSLLYHLTQHNPDHAPKEGKCLQAIPWNDLDKPGVRFITCIKTHYCYEFLWWRDWTISPLVNLQPINMPIISILSSHSKYIVCRGKNIIFIFVGGERFQTLEAKRIHVSLVSLITSTLKIAQLWREPPSNLSIWFPSVWYESPRKVKIEMIIFSILHQIHLVAQIHSFYHAKFIGIRL